MKNKLEYLEELVGKKIKSIIKFGEEIGIATEENFIIIKIEMGYDGNCFIEIDNNKNIKELMKYSDSFLINIIGMSLTEIEDYKKKIREEELEKIKKEKYRQYCKLKSEFEGVPNPFNKIKDKLYKKIINKKEEI